jgi:AbrB family looped-hinge helix DNA binding protein
MRVATDAAGRVVVPKAVRDELDLTAGSELELRVVDRRIELEVGATPMRLEVTDYGVVAVAVRPLPVITGGGRTGHPGAWAPVAYSVLTRLPETLRAEPVPVAEYIHRTFPARRLQLSTREQAAPPARPADLRISGGATYDGLIALTVRAAGEDLATLDRRAQAIYDRCGVSVRLLH